MTGDRLESPESKIDAKSQNIFAGWNLLELSKPDLKKAKAESRFVKPPVEPVPIKPPVEPPKEPPKPPIEPPKPPVEPPIEPPKPPVEPPKEPPKPPVKPPKPPVEPPKPPVEPPKPPVEPPSPPVEPPKPPRILRPSPSAFFEVPEFTDASKKPPVKPEPPLKADVPIVPALPVVPTGIPTAVQIVPEKKIDPGLPANPEQRQTSLIIQQLPEQPVPVIPTFPTPTGVFTGQGRDSARADRIYRDNYSTGERATPNHAHLISKAIGLNVDIDLVGTGKDRKMKAHQTEMVAPRDPHHIGQWKYDVPGKTILAGHVSFKGTPGPMYELRKLGVHNGISDTVTLESADGKKTNYVFAGRTILKDPHDQETWKKVFAPGNPDKKELVMVTCCGPVDSNGLHKWRLIVHLREAKTQPKPGAQSQPKAESQTEPKAETQPEPASDTAANPARAANQTATDAPKETAVTPDAAAKDAAAKESAAKAAAEKEAAEREAAAKATAEKEAATKAAADKEAAAKATQPTPSADVAQHEPQNTFRATTSSSGTRIRFDFNRNKNNSLTAEIGGEPGRISYGTFGPNFSLINKDKTKLDASLRLGYGNSLMPNTDLPYGGVPGLTISGQAVFGQRVGRDTSLYLGGAFGAHPGNKDIGYQFAAETGVVQRVGRFSLRAGLQESKVDGFAATTYGIGGISYRADKNTAFDLTLHKRLTNASGSGSRSGSDTLFFGVRHSF